LLGIDTATPATSVALHDGQRPLAAVSSVDPRRHAEVLGPAVADVLRNSGATMRDLTAVAVGVGPGPYTGLRVGVATATAVADALGLSAHGLCTLDVLARQAASGTPLTVVTDARRREVFWATYDGAGMRVAGPAVSRPADVAVVGRAVGPGVALYPDVFGAVADALEISAATLCALVAERLSCGDPLEQPRPIYLRRPDTAAPQPSKAVLQS
jgi:tRNA threonylcarbamoyl adenosine modification protein YeaZ